MANFRTLRIYHQAQQQLRDVAEVAQVVRFGDLGNQIRRAAISVVSNLVEGAGRGSDTDFARFLRMARGSNDEVAAQLEMVAALNGADLTRVLMANERLGKGISALIGRLE